MHHWCEVRPHALEQEVTASLSFLGSYFGSELVLNVQFCTQMRDRIKGGSVLEAVHMHEYNLLNNTISFHVCVNSFRIYICVHVSGEYFYIHTILYLYDFHIQLIKYT